MIDHVTLPVSDYQKSKAFYSVALKPLRYSLLQDAEDERWAGFGVEDEVGMCDFWIKQSPETAGATKYCIAFKAKSREMVEAFYHAALDSGGKNNGAPGYREKYSTDESKYYAAFVLDPDGYNIEAVFDDAI